MNTSQCTRSVYGYDWFSIIFIHFFFHVDVSAFLCFSTFYRNLSSSSFWPFNKIYHRYIIVTTLLSSVSLLYVSRSIYKTVFLAIPLFWPICYIVTHYTMLDTFRTSVFYQYFHRSFCIFLFRPTCVTVSMIVYLIFLFRTCRCFWKYEEIGGLWNECKI